MSLSKTLTALSGEYFVAAELCRRDIVASLTLKNYPGIDIFVYNPTTGKHGTVQVKTTRVHRSQGYWMPDPDQIEALGTPFVFVHLYKSEPPKFFVIQASKLVSLIKPEGAKYWYVSIKDLEAYEDQWDNLGIT